MRQVPTRWKVVAAGGADEVEDLFVALHLAGRAGSPARSRRPAAPRRRFRARGGRRRWRCAGRARWPARCSGCPAASKGSAERTWMLPLLSGRCTCAAMKKPGWFDMRRLPSTISVKYGLAISAMSALLDRVVRACEHAHRRDALRDEPVAQQQVARDLDQQPQSAPLAGQRQAAPLEGPLERRTVVVAQVLAHAAQRVDHRDAGAPQHVGVADARQLEQLRRGDGAGADDDLARGARLVRRAAAAKAYADTAPSFEHQRRDVRAAAQREVAAPARGGEVGVGHALPHATPDGQLRHRHAVLRGAAVVRR